MDPWGNNWMRHKAPLHNWRKTVLNWSLFLIFSSLSALDLFSERRKDVIWTVGGFVAELIFPETFSSTNNLRDQWMVPCPHYRCLGTNGATLFWEGKKRPENTKFLNAHILKWKPHGRHNYQHWFIWWLKTSIRHCQKLVKGRTVYVWCCLFLPLLSERCQ